MAKAITTTKRNSRTADLNKQAASSPFRSKSEQRRIKAAHEMARKRTEEIVGLETMLATQTLSVAQRRIAQQRLNATRRNLASWVDYLTGQNEMDEVAYREPRAVVIP